MSLSLNLCGKAIINIWWEMNLTLFWWHREAKWGKTLGPTMISHLHVSLTTSTSNSAPQGQVKATGWMPSQNTNSFPANTGFGPCKNCHTIPCGLYSSASEKFWLRKGSGEENSCFQQVIKLLGHSALLQHTGIFSSPAKFSPGWVFCYSWVQEQILAQRKGLTCSKTPQLQIRGKGESTGQLKVMMVKALQWKGEIVSQLHTKKPKYHHTAVFFNFSSFLLIEEILLLHSEIL